MTDLNNLFDNHSDGVPQPLGRQLAEQIKRIDPVVQLDATGCVLAKMLAERDRLREINAELLRALKATQKFLDNNNLGEGAGYVSGVISEVVAKAEAND